MIRKDNGSNNSLFLSCQMGLSDGAFFMIRHTPLPNGNHPISSPVCPMGVADTLEQCVLPGRFSEKTRMDPGGPWEDHGRTTEGPRKDQGRQSFTLVPGKTGLFNGCLISKGFSLWVKFPKVPNYSPEHLLFMSTINIKKRFSWE